MAKGKFQNLTINYRQMLEMPVQDRISIAKSTEGQSLMSALTPTQYASLFPSYYKDRAVLPNISGFEKALTSEGAARVSTSPQLAAGRSSAPGGTASPTALSRTLPGAVERLARRTGVNISDPGAKAQLSSEKKEVFAKLKRGEISADDPSVGFLKELSEADLKAAGIQKSEKDGRVSYSATPTKASQMTDEEVRASYTGKVRPGVEGLSSGQAIRKEVYDSFIKAGFSDKQAVALTAEVGRENGYNPKTMFGEHRDLNGKTNIGMFSHQGGRRDDFIKYMQSAGAIDPDTGQIRPTKDSLEAMARFYKQEMQTKPEYKATRDAFLANPDIDRDTAAAILGDNYIRWARHGNERIGFSRADAARHARGRDEYYAQIEAINQKFPGTLPANATPQQIAQARAELEAKENAGRELSLAEKTVSKAPPGLDPKLTEVFNKLNPGQKQRFIEALQKDGAGAADPTATGVARLNEALRADPENTQARIQAGVSQQGSQTLGFSDASVAERAEGLSDATKASLERFKVFAPERTVVTSTYRSPTHPIEASKRTPGAHARGQAIDVRTSDKTKEELAATVQALKKAGFNHILLEGDHIHAEVRPGQTEVNVSNLGKGNPLIDLRAARDAAAAVDYNVAMTQEQEKKMAEQAALKKLEDEQRPIQQRGLLAYTGQRTSPDKAQLFEQQDTATQVASLDRPKAAEAEQAQTEQTSGTPIVAFADGGEMAVNDGEISAQPINAIKGDNSVVVDGNKNPLFTMNTKEESANYDPDTGKVSVEPVSKNNPDELKSGEDKSTGSNQAADANETSQQNISQISSKNDSTASMPNQSFESTIQMSANPIQSASFGRAMAATRMMKSTDGLGGHFDAGATNLA